MEFIKNNAVQLLGLVFAAGVAFSEARSLHKDIDRLEDKIEKLEREESEVEDRVHNLEKCDH